MALFPIRTTSFFLEIDGAWGSFVQDIPRAIRKLGGICQSAIEDNLLKSSFNDHYVYLSGAVPVVSF
jgi:hypothetical protein